ncbi:DUF4214 domain-containing protein [Salinarimonas ramus]|uniref:DUF4214 domain-containing protein n=1 Tax=Salinarimonas ramus TaxID=690164 RepID=A0A917QEM8_9HYPH|nr:DUF4214 domain-containing protein [Salinarimonas ramus]GGK46973.1 hypothetical protein GCM10011322_37550 [Salinarimonas ramus]
MALVDAYGPINMIEPDLNWFLRNETGADFLPGSFLRPAGSAVREDTLYLFASDGFTDRALVLGGYGFLYDGFSLYDGIVQSVAEVDTRTNTIVWRAEDVSLRASAVYRAVETLSPADDANVFAAALNGADEITLEAPGSTAFGSTGADVVRIYGDGALVYGQDGNDYFVRAASGNWIDGGRDYDTVEYLGPRSSIRVDLASDGRVYVAAGTATDTLVSIERVQTTDGAYLYGLAEPFARAAYLLYGGAFDRTPDEGGFLFWTNQLARGATVDGVAAAFIASPEFASLYGTRVSDERFVDLLYQNVLGRGGDAQGVAYWDDYLASGRGDRADVLANFTLLPEFGQRVAPDIVDGYWVV